MFLSKTKLTLIIVLGLALFVACAPREEVKGEPAPATERPELKVAKITLATGVESRQPIDSAIVFPDSVGRVYCWTLILGAKKPTIIKHIWCYEKKKMAEVSLKVNSPQYRTWSCKTIRPQWKGDWRVWIVDNQGNLLGTASFKIE